jgi:hypothetical protein
MTRNDSAKPNNREIECINFRQLAAHHAIGLETHPAPEQRRLLELAVTEAEALACQTGVPELVLLSLAEEKVRNTRDWFARQAAVRNRSYLWPIAA